MRRVAWTRLWALALAIGLVAHAVVRAAAHAWLGEATITLETVGAMLLVRSRTRPVGVMVGAAAAALAACVALLSADVEASLAPTLLLGALLLLGRRMDRERSGYRPRLHSPVRR